MPNVDTSKKFDSVQKYRIRKLLSELSDKTGRGTELVSLYLPPKKPVHEAIAALREESGTASNIKSDVTRNHVQDALTKTMARLRLYKQTPENGIVIFCGAIPGPGGPGNETIELFEVLPQKPVSTYLYRCLAPETLILLDDNSQVPLKCLKEGAPQVVSFDFEKNEMVGASIEGHIETISGRRRVYKLTAESGRSVIATEDHPFFTTRGWIQAGDLNVGDLTCIKPTLEIPSNQVEDDFLLIDERDIQGLGLPSSDIESIIRILKERNLVPLRSTSRQIPVLSRLLGRLFGFALRERNTVPDSASPLSALDLDFCFEEAADYLDLKSDLNLLGVHLPEPNDCEIQVCNNSHNLFPCAIHAKVRDPPLCTLLSALGAHVSRGAQTLPVVPSWLFRVSSMVQKEFLSAYIGIVSEPPDVDSNLCSKVCQPFPRLIDQSSAIEFGRDIARLLLNFDIRVDMVSARSVSNEKNDSIQLELHLSNSQTNILKLCHSIGYRYCKRKSLKADYMGEYLRIKDYSRYLPQIWNNTTAFDRSLVPSFPTNNSQNSSSLTILSSVHESAPQNFRDWMSTARQNLPNGLLWETLVSIEPVQMSRVMDLTIGSASHNFFANGFLVHNCDDHFHIEPLRDMLREENVIGVLSMDSTEAGLGIVSGDSWEVVDTMSSGVSGKTRKGGQCVSSDSFVQLDDGSLVEISKVGRHSRIASYNFVSNSLGYYHCADVFSVVPEDYYEIFTNHPNLNIRTTSEHRFFAPGPNGIVTKHAFELKEGDALLVPARLPEVGQPDLRTRFPSEINHNIDLQGQRLLRQLRTRAKISQRTLAGRAGLTQADISRLEHGEQNPGWDKLQRLISLLVADTEEFVASHVTSNAGLPEFFSKELLQLMGYISGNGILGKDVILLSESDYDVSYLYSNLINKSLGIRALPVISRIDRRRHVKSSGATYETRIQSPSFRDAIKKYYPQIVSNMKREIPEQIHHLDNYHLKYFLRGLFDAKGKISGPVLCVNARSSALIRQVQLLLLRFGIRSSQAERGTCKNVVFHLHIDDTKSILVFNREIGFSEQKRMVLEQDPKRENTSCIECRTHGQGSYQTHRDHRQNKQLSKTFKGPGGSFSSAPRNPGDVLRENWQTGRMRESGGGLLMEDVFATATTSMSKDLVLAKVARIKISKNVKHVKFVDVELPETMSFIGNGFVLHNSARRYERLREMELTDYFNRLADHSKKAFLEQYQIKGLIVSGPGPTKDEFVRDKYLDYRLQNMIVGTLDSGYSGREGVRETIEKAGKLLENVRVIEEKKLVQRFFREVNSDSGLAIYGVRDILAALKKAAVDTIIINDDVDMVYLKAVCNKCGNVTEKFVTRAQIVNEKQSLLVCPKCGSNEIQIAEKDIVDYLADAAIDSGADVEVISSKTEDGSMLKNFGGISAILRYRI